MCHNHAENNFCWEDAVIFWRDVVPSTNMTVHWYVLSEISSKKKEPYRFDNYQQSGIRSMNNTVRKEANKKYSGHRSYLSCVKEFILMTEQFCAHVIWWRSVSVPSIDISRFQKRKHFARKEKNVLGPYKEKLESLLREIIEAVICIIWNEIRCDLYLSKFQFIPSQACRSFCLSLFILYFTGVVR